MVHTGHYPNSGTKSKVSFILTGDWDETDVRTLEDEHRPILRRGDNNHFIMTTHVPLGPLQYMRVWHDNSGKGSDASWYFSYFVVRDVQTGEVFQFICNNWLAVEEGDGQIDRVVPVAGEEQLREYAHVFAHSVEKNLSDDHLWFSVFLRPARSRFTRVQRLSACMALLYLSMLVNAMFYQRIPDGSSAGINFGPFSVSPEALSVGFFSNLIVFPPSFCIVFFFRKARPRNKHPSRLQLALNQQKLRCSEIEKEKDSSPGTTKSLQSRKADQHISTISRYIDRSAPHNKSSKSYSEDCKGDDSIKRKEKKFTLPWWFVIVAWTLVAVSIGSAVFFLWAYGIQFGNEKCTKWLTALLSSIVSSVLFTQPLKIYLTAMLLSLILKRPLDEHEDYDDDEEIDVDVDELWLHPNNDVKPGTPKKRKVRIGAGFSDTELLAARKKREQEIAMNRLIGEITVYMIFLTIILSISYGGRDPSIFLMRENFQNMFTVTGTNNCPAFTSIVHTKQYWCWVREILLPGLLNTRLYNGEKRPWIMRGTISDHITYLFGNAILRQIRTKPDTCTIHPVMRDFFTHCAGESSLINEEERSFGVSWNATTPFQSYYKYRSALKIHGFPYDGKLALYGGGGYLVAIKGNEKKATEIMDGLETNGWIDQYTRAVFVELSLYNPQIPMPAWDDATALKDS